MKLEYQIDLKIDKARESLRNFLRTGSRAGRRFGNNFKSQFGNAVSGLSSKIKNTIRRGASGVRNIGSQSGNAFGGGFREAVNAALATISFATLIQQSNKAIQEYKNLINSNIKLKNAIKQVNGVKLKDVRSEVDNLFNELDRSVSKTTIRQSFGELFRGGIKDVETAKETLKGFIDVSSAGKSEFLSLDEAVKQLSEQFRNERAELGETAGLTEEYASQILPKGIEKLQEQGKLVGENTESLSKQERALAKVAGLQSIFNRNQGNFNSQLDSGLLLTDKFSVQIKQIRQSFGKVVKPIRDSTIKGVLPLLGSLDEFIKKKPTVTLALTGITVAVTALTSVFLVLGAKVSAVVAGIIATFALFTAAYKKNFGGFRTFIQKIANDVRMFINNNRNEINNTLTQIRILFNQFIAIVEPVFRSFIQRLTVQWNRIVNKVLPKIIPIINNIVIITRKSLPILKIVFENVFKSISILITMITGVIVGLVDTIKGTTNAIVGILTGDREKITKGFQTMFGGVGQVVESIMKGVINNIINGLNSAIKLVNKFAEKANVDRFKMSTIPRFQGFAEGGKVKGKGTGTSDSIPAMLSNGEYVINAKSAEQFEPLLKAINNMNAGNSNNNVDNSRNINITNNNDSASGSFLPTFLLPS